MSSQLLELNCFVLGDNPQHDIFPVKIENHKILHYLKEAIFEKKSQAFNDIVDSDLDLWRVSIPDNDEIAAKLSSIRLEDSDGCHSMWHISWRLARYFPESPLKEHLHVLVQRPISGEYK
jgi:Crinkler effector protein N-terminal domain